MIRTGLILTLGILLVGSWTTLADQAAESDISGVYQCDGLNGDGSRYAGYVIIAKHRDTYRVQWIFESRRGAAGIGIRDGDTLAVSYFGGLAMYKIDGAQLVGRWTVPDAEGQLASETLQRVKEVPPSLQPREQPGERPREERRPDPPPSGIRL
jgi:hypothetical protein